MMTTKNPHDALTEQMYREADLRRECEALRDDLEKVSRAYDELLYAAENAVVYFEKNGIRQ